MFFFLCYNLYGDNMIYNIKDKMEYLDEVVLLEHNEWASNKEDDIESRLKRKKEKIISMLDNKSFCKLILVENNNLIGFISLFPYEKETDEIGPWYATMYVKKEYRGLGYSKLLNNAILEEARRLGFKKVYLKSDLENYYEKFGAKLIGQYDDKEKLYVIELGE